jgi:hypothetical protein
MTKPPSTFVSRFSALIGSKRSPERVWLVSIVVVAVFSAAWLGLYLG